MRIVARLSIAGLLVSGTVAARAEVVHSPDGKVVSFIQRASSKLDLARGRPIPLPTSRRPLPSRVDMLIAAAKARSFGSPAVFSGSEGNGQMTAAVRARPSAGAPGSQSEPQFQSGGGGVGSQEYGTSNQVYTTSRAPSATNTVYRRAGKLLFQTSGGDVAFCSASLIKRGVIVTAAHCVFDNTKGGSTAGFYNNWQYIPAYKSGSGPYGTGLLGGDDGVFYAKDVFITGGYYANTDTCTDNRRIVCDDDVAVIVLKPDTSGKYPGEYTGWFGYAVNGYGFSAGQTQIAQLGYPADLDRGELMERNDARGVVSSSDAGNTVIGSLMGGGSSGGPWLVNFGVPPVRDAGVTQGAAPKANIVVGVTSWGILYDDGISAPPKQMGASPFTAGNIKFLLESSGGACALHPDAC